MQIVRLREATTADHASVESSLPFLREDLDLEMYVTALQRLYSLVAAWELFAEEVASLSSKALVLARSRRTLLAADLCFLAGSLKIVEVAKLPDLATEPAFFGALYVMEGSRLGGQLLARHIESALHLSHGQGTAYFRGFGEQTGSNWNELIAVLEASVSDTDAELAVEGARAMFQTFEQWMALACKPDGSRKPRMGPVHGG